MKLKKYKHRLGRRQPTNSPDPSRPSLADFIACGTNVLNDSALLQQFSITPDDWGTENLYERRYILEWLMRHVGWRMFATTLRQSFIWDLAVGMFGISLIEWEDTPLKKPPGQCLAEFGKTVWLTYPFLARFFQHTQKVVPFGHASYDPSDIGERLKTLRETLLKDRVISVVDLSQKSGVEVSAIKDIERGATKRPRDITLMCLAQALSKLSGKEVPIDEIYPLHLRHQPGRPGKKSPTSEPSADPQNGAIPEQLLDGLRVFAQVLDTQAECQVMTLFAGPTFGIPADDASPQGDWKNPEWIHGSYKDLSSALNDMWMEPAVLEEAASKTPKMTALREWRRQLKEWLAQEEAEDAELLLSESEEESNSKATSAKTNSSTSNSNTADN